MNKIPENIEERSEFHNEMMKYHTHVELVYENNPSEIVYTEDVVLTLMKLVRDKTLDWAADNVMTRTISVYNGGLDPEKLSMYDDMEEIDRESILIGKTHKDLKI